MQNATPQKKGMPLWQKLAIALVVLIVIGKISGSTDEPKPAAKTKEGIEISKITQGPHPESHDGSSEGTRDNWSYSDQEDQMTSKKNYFARTTSTNTVHFEFPYNGGSEFYLTIRKKGSKLDAYINVSKGQFNGSFGSDNSVRVRFDKGEASVFSVSGAADGSSDIIFFDNPKRLISKLKGSKKMLVEAEFYQGGNRVMEFDTEGFEWSH